MKILGTIVTLIVASFTISLVGCTESSSPGGGDQDSLTVFYAGKTYHVVHIGSQYWLKENLDVGTMIQGSNSASNDGTLQKYCYNDSAVNCERYGGLYQWSEAMRYLTSSGGQGICPPGWHIPSNAEMDTLCDVRVRSSNDLKAVGEGTGPGSGTNTSGFSALLAGARTDGGSFASRSTYGYFWTSDQENSTTAWFMRMNYVSGDFYNSHFDKREGFSVRCIKD